MGVSSCSTQAMDELCLSKKLLRGLNNAEVLRRGLFFVASLEGGELTTRRGVWSTLTDVDFVADILKSLDYVGYGVVTRGGS